MAEVVLRLHYSDDEVARLDATFIAAFVGNLMRRDVLAERWSLTIDGIEFMPVASPLEYHGVSEQTVQTLLERRRQRADEGH